MKHMKIKEIQWSVNTFFTSFTLFMVNNCPASIVTHHFFSLFTRRHLFQLS